MISAICREDAHAVLVELRLDVLVDLGPVVLAGFGDDNICAVWGLAAGKDVIGVEVYLSGGDIF